MKNERVEGKKGFRGLLLLPTLLLGVFLEYTGVALLSTLYVDIAATFKVSIGTATTLSLISAALGLIMGLAISAISLKFKHKYLFVSGIAFLCTGILIFFFAPNFAAAELSYFFTGVGAPIVGIMTYTLIGELFPLEKRGWLVGLTVSTLFAAYLIVGPLSGYVEGVAGWRAFLLWFSFPLSLVCFGLGLLIIPSIQPHTHSAAQSMLKQAYKQVFLKKSAIACIACSTFAYFLSITSTWNISFVRIAFAVSPFIGGVFRAVAAAGAVVGGAAGGRLINRVGRKPIAATGIFVSAVAIITYTFVPSVALAVVELILMASTLAFALVGLNSLILEQVPGFRSSMMSVNATFQNIGTFVGIMIGTIVLTSYNNNFHMLYVILGGLGVVAVPVLLLLTRDPTKTASKSPTNDFAPQHLTIS